MEALPFHKLGLSLFIKIVRMKLVVPLLVLLLPLLSGCGFVDERHLVGNYDLIAYDNREDLGVCYHRQGGEVAPHAGITRAGG